MSSAESSDDDESKNSSDNWDSHEMATLLTVWKKYVAELDRASHKRHVYKKMSERMKSSGVYRDRYAVQIKINKLKEMYRKNMPTKKTGYKSKWCYWKATDEILGEPDSEESSFDDEDREKESSDSQPGSKRIRHASRGRPAASRGRGRPPSSSLRASLKIKAPVRGRATKDTARGKSRGTPPARKAKKVPPRDEVLEKLMAQDQVYERGMANLELMFSETANHVTDTQRRSQQTISLLSSHFQFYLDHHRRSSEGNGGNPLEKANGVELAQLPPLGMFPNGTRADALMPLIRTILGPVVELAAATHHGM